MIKQAHKNRSAGEIKGGDLYLLSVALIVVVAVVVARCLLPFGSFFKRGPNERSSQERRRR